MIAHPTKEAFRAAHTHLGQAQTQHPVWYRTTRIHLCPTYRFGLFLPHSDQKRQRDHITKHRLHQKTKPYLRGCLAGSVGINRLKKGSFTFHTLHHKRPRIEHMTVRFGPFCLSLKAYTNELWRWKTRKMAVSSACRYGSVWLSIAFPPLTNLPSLWMAIKSRKNGCIYGLFVL